jgi:outer membrane protein assembly factor BamB
MKRTFSFILVCQVLLSGCDWFKPDPPEPPTPPADTSKITVVWRRPFPNNQYYGSCIPAIYGDKVIFSNYPASGPEKFYAFDAATGKQQYWVWNDYMSSNAEDTDPSRWPSTFDNILCIAPGNGFIGIDMNTGQTLWKNRFTSTVGKNQFETMIVAPYADFTNNTRGIRLVDMKTGVDRVVMTIDTISTPFANVQISSFERNIDNDTIINFSFRQLFTDTAGVYNRPTSTFYVYNLTQNKIIWQTSEMTSAGGSKIIGDNIVVIDDARLLCYRKADGQKVWEQPYPRQVVNFMETFEDKIILLDLGSPGLIHAYDKFTGAPKWSVPYGGKPSQPVYYKGLIYFTAQGYLWAIRVSTGELVWQETCPDVKDDSGSFWSFGVNVDPVRNKLYVASFTGAFCLEPAE